MKKVSVILLFLLSASLIATDDKKINDAIKEHNNYHENNNEWPDRSRSRSISYDTRTESSDLSCDDSSSDDDSDSDESLEEDIAPDKLINALRQGKISEKMLFERLMPYGGHIFGGMMVVLIAYKFYRAGYL